MPKRRSEDHSEKGTEVERKQLTEDIVRMHEVPLTTPRASTPWTAAF